MPCQCLEYFYANFICEGCAELHIYWTVKQKIIFVLVKLLIGPSISLPVEFVHQPHARLITLSLSEQEDLFM